MRTNLLETYSRQLKVAEAYVAKNFDGKAVSANTQLTTAVLLDNTNRWMTESMNMVAGGNRSDLGDWKKFCLNLTNIAVPSLIANDLVIVHPMTSYSGSVAYLEYVSLTDKGDVKKGDMFNSVFGHGEMTEARQNFTSQVIVETVGDDAKLTLADSVVVGGLSYRDEETREYKTATYKVNGEYVDSYTPKAGDKVAYMTEQFQMEKIPSKEIPAIGPRMKHIPLVAEPRRIAVRYDQITAFQA